ncbi:MAG: hypothetical protein PWR21_2046 [Methanoculleus sp.]|nr:hypothetical protein [Methanoculleus sp.]
MALLKTTKILDNTVISAAINEIKAVDLLSICNENYAMVTSMEVFHEACGGSRHRVTKEYQIEIRDKAKDQKFTQIISYLCDRYPYLHEGELSAFTLALLDYACSGESYFFVTDDRTMRRRIDEIIASPQITNVCQMQIQNFNHTGTIGLIRRLYQKRCLSNEEIDEIIANLRESTFYITEELLNELKRC